MTVSQNMKKLYKLNLAKIYITENVSSNLMSLLEIKINNDNCRQFLKHGKSCLVSNKMDIHYGDRV